MKKHRKAFFGLVAVIFGAACVLMPQVVSAKESQTNPQYQEYQEFQYYIDEDGVHITAYLGGEKELAVPAQIAGKPVRSVNLGDGTIFSGSNEDRKLTKVKLPDGIQSFGGMGGCVCLREIALPDSVEQIDDDAFRGCRKLKSVKMSKNLKKIGDHAFGGCISLEKIMLPEGLESIGDCAFLNCRSLKKLRMPDTVVFLGEEGFDGCKCLKEVILSNRLTDIGAWTFCGCRKLKKIKIPGNVTAIGDKAFQGSGLTEVLLPAKVRKIGEYAFLNCKNLRKVTIGGSKTIIGVEAFWGIHKKAVFHVPAKSVARYKGRLEKSRSFSGKKLTVKGGR